MPDELVLFVCSHDGDVVHAIAHGDVVMGDEHDADGVRGTALRTASRSDAPLTVHAQVRVQAEPVVGAQQDVLAARDDINNGSPREIARRELRHPEVRGYQGLTAERITQKLRGQPDGVAFGHPPTLTAASSRWRS